MFLLVAIAAVSGRPAWALIFGGIGNDPLRDPGWPKGAAAVFNTVSRLAYWEGPPFGGGQYHAECRGDEAAFQRVLDDFAKIETPLKRVVVHDGVAHSFWLSTTGKAEKPEDAKIDWVFMVWHPESRAMQRRLPIGISAVGKRDAAILAQLDVYTGGLIHWNKVTIPEDLEVVDQRLEAHGFTSDDGTVLEGDVIDLATRKPLKAKVDLQLLSEKGDQYTSAVEVSVDDNGHWVVKKAPQGSCRLVLTAEGYAARVIAYGNYDNQPQWIGYDSGLAKPGTVTGRVVDPNGQPLADVTVRIDDLDVKNSGRYDVPAGTSVQTDAEGQFSITGVPIASAVVRVHKPGYVRPGLGEKITIPAADLKLEMQQSARLKVTVDFGRAKRPDDYMVHLEPEGGEQIGKWSGGGSIDASNVITFEGVPEGRYVVSGRPNPGREDQQTKPVPVDLKGGETTQVTIKAK
jgi:hypothetical protein